MKSLYSSSQSEEHIMGSGGLSKVCCCYCRKSSREMSTSIAIADMVIFSFFFLFVLTATIILILCPEMIMKIFPFEEDLQNFIEFEASRHTSRYRWFILGLLMSWCLAEIGFAQILYHGAKKFSYPMVRGWIFLIIIDCLFSTIVFIPLAVFASQKFIYIVFALVYYAYRLFSLWTVHELLKEILSHMPWV